MGASEILEPAADWFELARDVTTFDLDVVYEAPEFCPGWLLPRVRQRALVRVPRPSFPIVHGGVLTADAAGREAELASYYARFPRLPPKIVQSETARFCCFNVGMLLRAGDGVAIYADAFGGGHLATEALLEQLADGNAEPHVAYDNLDQGWALQIHVQERHVAFIEWDWADDDPRSTAVVVRVDRGELARQASAARARMAVLQPLLIGAVGRDLWASQASQ